MGFLDRWLKIRNGMGVVVSVHHATPSARARKNPRASITVSMSSLTTGGAASAVRHGPIVPGRFAPVSSAVNANRRRFCPERQPKTRMMGLNAGST